MSLHQIIYTSCMRGINGVNDGQQVFSYDASFTEAGNDEVKSLFSYQPPMLEPGVVMTEELAPTLPRSFIYRRLESGQCALALCTYLGRDYMGSAGRFGNHLSHVIVADEADLKHYPCEYFGSSMLRDHMEYEEVNNPNKPDYLPKPVPERGYVVDVDSVVSFLGEGDRMEIYQNMLQAVMRFEADHKRVVICDEPENIVMWIAALQYAFPLRTALKISFSTYDFDPSLSASQICGVIPKGSRYTEDSRRYHFVFDMFDNVITELERDEQFFEFVDTAMSFSYDSMQDFHRFLTNGYTYSDADENMVAAYHLYSMMSDGIGSLSPSQIQAALTFAEQYAHSEEYERVIRTLIANADALSSLDIATFFAVARRVLDRKDSMGAEDKKAIRRVLVEKVLREFGQAGDQKDAFLRFYGEIDALARENGIVMGDQLMSDVYRTTLFETMQQDAREWKIAFAVKVFTSFAKEHGAKVDDLMIEAPLGQIYYGLIGAVYAISAQKGYFLVTNLLDAYAYDCTYLVNMALNIEGVLMDLPNGNQETAALWSYFGQVAVGARAQDLTKMCSIFSSYDRDDQMYALYSLAVSRAQDIAACRTIFTEHYNGFVSGSQKYAAAYGTRILEEYYEKLRQSTDVNVRAAMADLFYLIYGKKLKMSFAQELIGKLVTTIPYEKPTAENSKLIRTAFDYLYNDLGEQLSGKILLLVMATAMDKCTGKSEMKAVIDNLEVLTKDQKGQLPSLSEGRLAQYFEWITPNICKLCVTTADIERVMSLYDMNDDCLRVFCSVYTQLYYKQNKNEKEADAFCEFLRYLFDIDSEAVYKELSTVLRKLKKPKMMELNRAVAKTFGEDKDVLERWEAIQKAAESSNPFFSKFTGLFKRKKGE